MTADRACQSRMRLRMRAKTKAPAKVAPTRTSGRSVGAAGAPPSAAGGTRTTRRAAAAAAAEGSVPLPTPGEVTLARRDAPECRRRRGRDGRARRARGRPPRPARGRGRPGPWRRGRGGVRAPPSRRAAPPPWWPPRPARAPWRPPPRRGAHRSPRSPRAARPRGPGRAPRRASAGVTSAPGCSAVFWRSSSLTRAGLPRRRADKSRQRPSSWRSTRARRSRPAGRTTRGA